MSTAVDPQRTQAFARVGRHGVDHVAAGLVGHLTEDGVLALQPGGGDGGEANQRHQRAQTTLLRCLSGLLRPSAGEIRYEGAALEEKRDRATRRARGARQSPSAA